MMGNKKIKLALFNAFEKQSQMNIRTKKSQISEVSYAKHIDL